MNIKLYGFRPDRAEATMNKGTETGDLMKDGYRVLARARDDYSRDRRRDPDRNQTPRIFSKKDEDYET